ncbi:MAG: hypothetical protein ACJAYJ_002553 [Saprospiraceae bacterium]|jgi:hypothetical protein
MCPPIFRLTFFETVNKCSVALSKSLSIKNLWILSAAVYNSILVILLKFSHKKSLTPVVSKNNQY